MFNTTLLVLTIVGIILRACSKGCLKYVLSVVFKGNERYKAMRADIAEARSEMSSISMVDEFARHARLQRKVIKLQEELKTENQKLSYAKLKYEYVVGGCLSVLLEIFMIVLLYVYRREPVLIVPKDWLSPFSLLIEWPTEVSGAISAVCWSAITFRIGRQIAG